MEEILELENSLEILPKAELKQAIRMFLAGE